MKRRKAFCKHCGDPIQWVPVASGLTMVPLMDSPDPAGNWEIVGGVARRLEPQLAAAVLHEGGLLFKRHPMDCTTRGVPCPDYLREQLGLKPRSRRGESGA